VSAAPLRVTDLHAYYGESHVLHGVTCHVDQGEVVTLLGRNGAGRTTTLRALLGLVSSRSGSVMINGQQAIALPPHRIAHLGVGYCPEERGIYASLSAEENLQLPPPLAPGGLTVEEISEGLAPVIVQTLSRTIRRLRERGYTIVMVEQNFRFAAPLADRFYIMERGRIVADFAAAQLQAKMSLLHEFLGI